MSGQYLEAHAFLETLRDKGVPYMETLVNLMKYAVIEEVSPVVHAEWTRKRTQTHDGELYCSNCEWSPEVLGGTTLGDLQLADVYFCPHCGARMDGGRNDG